MCKIKVKKKKVDEYSIKCPNCGKLIVGFTKKQVEYNYDIHFRSCKKKMEEKNERKK